MQLRRLIVVLTSLLCGAVCAAETAKDASRKDFSRYYRQAVGLRKSIAGRKKYLQKRIKKNRKPLDKLNKEIAEGSAVRVVQETSSRPCRRCGRDGRLARTATQACPTIVGGKTCTLCGGRGKRKVVTGYRDCPTCKGSGRRTKVVEKSERVTLSQYEIRAGRAQRDALASEVRRDELALKHLGRAEDLIKAAYGDASQSTTEQIASAVRRVKAMLRELEGLGVSSEELMVGLGEDFPHFQSPPRRHKGTRTAHGIGATLVVVGTSEMIEQAKLVLDVRSRLSLADHLTGGGLSLAGSTLGSAIAAKGKVRLMAILLRNVFGESAATAWQWVGNQLAGAKFVEGRPLAVRVGLRCIRLHLTMAWSYRRSSLTMALGRADGTEQLLAETVAAKPFRGRKDSSPPRKQPSRPEEKPVETAGGGKVNVPALHAALKAKNPRYAGKGKFVMHMDRLYRVDLQRCGLTNIGPLGGLKFRELRIDHNRISDLSPIAGVPLTYLHCAHNPIRDLSPLGGAPLAELYVHDAALTDLSPLSAMKTLVTLYCQNNHITDLSPLKGLPLVILDCSGNPIRDFTPLQGMSIQVLKR